jgi:hypothetical protein
VEIIIWAWKISARSRQRSRGRVIGPTSSCSTSAACQASAGACADGNAVDYRLASSDRARRHLLSAVRGRVWVAEFLVDLMGGTFG